MSETGTSRLEELENIVSEDPGNLVFAELGNLYLEQNRPLAALQVAIAGVRRNPEAMVGRFMAARAFVMIHKWDEAQTELVKVVSREKRNRDAFQLLGEVLIRKGDYRRAVPVLEHAQKLDGTDREIANLLACALREESLPAPPPPPNESIPMKASPKKQAKPFGGNPGVSSGTVPRDSLTQILPPLPDDGSLDDDPVIAPPRAAAPSVPKVMPRVFVSDKRADAAATQLQTSASMGDQLLNQLLTDGLLDVDGVPLVLNSVRSYPRSRSPFARKMIRFAIFAAVISAVAGGGMVYWDIASKKERVRQRQEELLQASELVRSGTFVDLQRAQRRYRNVSSGGASAPAEVGYAKVQALSGMLYGTPGVEEVGDAIVGLPELSADDIGYTDSLVARGAYAVTAVEHNLASVDTLNGLLAPLDAAGKDDPWAKWISLRLMATKGMRSASLQGLESLAQESDLALAKIDYANALVDAGKAKDALPVFRGILKEAKEHPLAILGNGIARNESGSEPAATIGDINIYLDEENLEAVAGVGGAAYRNVVLSTANRSQEYYADAAKNLESISDEIPARILARLVIEYAAAGRVEDAVASRKKIYRLASGEINPVILRADGEVALAKRELAAAARLSKHLEGVQGWFLRGRALLLSGKYKEAKTVLEKAAAEATEDPLIALWLDAATFVTASESKQGKVARRLVNSARRMKTKTPLFLHGWVRLHGGDIVEAQKLLEQSLEGIGDDAPNPHAGVAHYWLANIAIWNDDIPAAKNHLNKAKKILPELLWLKGLEVRTKGGDKRKLAKLSKDEQTAWPDELALAQAEGVKTESGKKALRRAVSMGASLEIAQSLEEEKK